MAVKHFDVYNGIARLDIWREHAHYWLGSNPYELLMAAEKELQGGVYRFDYQPEDVEEAYRDRVERFDDFIGENVPSSFYMGAAGYIKDNPYGLNGEGLILVEWYECPDDPNDEDLELAGKEFAEWAHSVMDSHTWERLHDKIVREWENTLRVHNLFH